MILGYARLMTNLMQPADERPYGAFGEFEDMPPMTDEEWAEHDRWVAIEIARADEAAADEGWDF